MSAPDLAAILASPDDLALRAVYADALLERGDPRGEFISLQLAHGAGRATAASLRRELELIAAHRVAWMGSLGRWFSPRAPVFDGGFFAGGDLRRTAEPDLDAMLEDPGWPLVHTLGEVDELAPAVLHGPGMRRIRRLTGLHEAEAIDFLARVKTLPLDAFAVRLQYVGREAKHPLATCAALPALRTLALENLDARTAKIFAAAPIIERLERLQLELNINAMTDHIPGLVAALAKRRGTLRTIEIRCTKRAEDLGWAITLQRDAAPGPFADVTARHASLKPLSGADAVSGCWRAINRVPRTAIRRLVIDLAVPCRLPAAAQSKLVAAVGEMTNLVHVAVPWQLAARLGAGTRYDGGFQGRDLLADIPRTWAVFVDDLGQTYDTYAVNERGAPALGKAPLPTLVKRAKEARTESLTLRRDGHPELVKLVRRHAWHATTFSVTTPLEPEALISWFVRALALGPFEDAHLHLGDQRFEWDALRLGEYATPDAGWLVALGPKLVPWLPVAAVTAAKVRVIPAKDHLVLALAATPAQLTPARVGAVAAKLIAILDAQVAARLKLDFPRHAIAALAGVARARRLPAKPTVVTPSRVVWGRERLIMELGGVIDGDLDVRLGDDGGDVARADFATKAGLRAALAKVAKVGLERTR